MVRLTLTVDHRLVNGMAAAAISLAGQGLSRTGGIRVSKVRTIRAGCSACTARWC
ncbi:MAG: 2-oxo acid dehydrogenase subunit E2 [Desulfobacterales bacterium]|nr:2-oxo acid dehydrogenase subunit E2 [Desulfobacterales bacterium]